MPGDKFQPRKGQEVCMLRKIQAPVDLRAAKSRPKRTSKVTTLCQYSSLYYQSLISLGNSN